MYVLSLLQNKFGLVIFRLFDGALETSNFRFEEARPAITLLRCFLHENTQRGKIARVKFVEELGTMSKNRLRWITLVRGPIWGIHSLTLMISCFFLLLVFFECVFCSPLMKLLSNDLCSQRRKLMWCRAFGKECNDPYVQNGPSILVIIHIF